MTPLNEADTRAKLIDPKLKASGWGESEIEREHFFRKGQPFTNGRIYLVGREARRGQQMRRQLMEAELHSHSTPVGKQVRFLRLRWQAQSDDQE
jgi:type I site-specific restriction endonuclease